MTYELSLNTGTTPSLSVADAVAATATAGLGHIGLWRHRVAEVGAERAATLVHEAGLEVTSLCRGGFLTGAGSLSPAEALASNRAAIDECVALGTTNLIMVVGGLPDGQRDLVVARDRVRAGLAELAPYAEQHGVCLVLEPLHPMYCADRAVLSTLDQALDWAEPYDPSVVGIVVDTFHVFWDPAVESAIERVGAAGRLASYQVCDFNLPIASDALMSRGMMGDGVVDFARISRAVAKAGYTGPVEVEIFNEQVNAAPATEVLATMTNRYQELVLPHLESAGDWR